MHDGKLSSQERRVLYLALGARIAVVFLALCTSLLIAPFDNSGFIALQSYNDSPAQSIARTSATNLDAAIPFLQNLALPFTQWDTIHFLAIAREGYVDEQKFAFLPGVPALLALAGRLPHILGLPQYVCSPTAAVLSVSVLASCLSCLTPLVLYRLTYTLVGSSSFANISSLLYILAPAPAILSVPYTEPFYAFFTFAGMLYTVSRPPRLIKAAVCFAIAGSFRANGILNIGFLAWQLVWQMRRFRIAELVKKVIQLAGLSMIVAAPFVLHQSYAYMVFCTDNFRLPQPWCHRSFPIVYSDVQEKYWNVGFLRYWTLQQLPNFILAAPVLFISVSASVTYYSQTWPRCFYRSLPFTGSSDDIRDKEKSKASQHPQHPFHEIQLLPFIHLHTIITLLLLFASHVQIALRQAATNPVIFWYAAYLVQKRDGRAKWWTAYCMIWGSVSIILWTLFYPPA